MITRRSFINRMGLLLAAGVLGGPFMLAACRGKTDGKAAAKMLYRYNQEPNLRQIAARRLHHGNERFRNIFDPDPRRSFGQVLRWKFFSKNRHKHLYSNERVKSVTLDWTPLQNRQGLSVTFVKHAGLFIKDGGSGIWIDPVFDGIPGFIKDFSPLKFDPQALPESHYVLVTHGHYDHLDTDSLKSLAPGPQVITPLGYGKMMTKLGFTKRTELDWYETAGDKSRHITLLPCRHWTMRNPIVGPNRELWGSYLIRTRSGPTIYVSGDTAYFEGFKEIGREYDIDLAIINLGAYEPRWFMAQSHLNPAETVQAFRDLKARRLMVVHWGTFRLGNEPIYLPPLELKQELSGQGLSDRLMELDHGETFSWT